MIGPILFLLALQPSPEVIAHLTAACTIVWEGKPKATIDRCVGRTLEAMGTEETLRARELQRKLVKCVKDLEALEEKK
jgi:hypothetical protein